jgi:3-phosphoshikimate 1-carboxyvinyltransferase
MDPRSIRTTHRPLDAVVRAVPSKSVTHRALVAAALAQGKSTVRGPLRADDTRITLEGLRALGVHAECDDESWIVHGRGGELPGGGEIELGQSGTSMRFLVALAALGDRVSTLDGAQRLRERPVRELVNALHELGADVDAAPSGGGLPVRAGGQRMTGGAVRIRAGLSSQFASALLLVGSKLEQGLDLTLDPPVVSLPYIEVTEGVLAAYGAPIERLDRLRWRVRPGSYEGREYRVEGDHSSASYFLAAAAVAGGRVRVEGLDPASRQPDARLAHMLADAGCEVESGPDWIEVRSAGPLRAIDRDMSEAPDLVPTIAVLALFAEGRSVFRGIGHLRIKESDRLETVAANLRTLGCDARAVDDRLEILPDRTRLHGGLIETASDHRLAMAFAVVGLVIDGVRIDDPGCVSKSNAGFWDQLEHLIR